MRLEGVTQRKRSASDISEGSAVVVLPGLRNICKQRESDYEVAVKRCKDVVVEVDPGNYYAEMLRKQHATHMVLSWT